MWISRRNGKSLRLIMQPRRNRNIYKRLKITEKEKLNSGIWKILPQGLWIKMDQFSSGDNNNFLSGLQKAFKGAFDSDNRKEMIQYQQKKIETAMEMTDYVSNMMKDYFTSDNLWKIVSKPNDVSIIGISK